MSKVSKQLRNWRPVEICLIIVRSILKKKKTATETRFLREGTNSIQDGNTSFCIFSSREGKTPQTSITHRLKLSCLGPFLVQPGNTEDPVT